MQLYLTMPKPGETIREGVVVQWLKKEGEKVQEKDALVELETEKAVFTFESPFVGVLQKILVEANSSCEVGKPIALFEVSQEDGERYLMLGVGMPADGAPTVRSTPSSKQIQKTPEKPVRTQAQAAPSSRALSPLIRNLARENNLSEEELAQIPASGPGGRLTKEDVLKYLKNVGAVLAPPDKGAASSTPTQNLLSPIRQRIAQHMKKSHEQIPAAGSSVDVDFHLIWNYCQKNKQSYSEEHGVALSPFHFFLFAVREALKKYPNFNASYIEEGGKGYLQKHSQINLGVAVATLQGLFTPVIHQADKLSFRDLAQTLSQLEAKTKMGKLSVEELTGATFVVNNPGAVGGNRCLQIIPLPMVAIVAINRIQKRPWVVEEAIGIREVAAIDLAFDHRPLDGADGILFLEEVKKNLEHFDFEAIDS